MLGFSFPLSCGAFEQLGARNRSDMARFPRSRSVNFGSYSRVVFWFSVTCRVLILRLKWLVAGCEPISLGQCVRQAVLCRFGVSSKVFFAISHLRSPTLQTFLWMVERLNIGGGEG
jgi:hypothetical protein